ncbi:DUF1508 domain-containing protein [Natrononativus amylolyticus]|uniref:DUF1508 domain-containing protein n=1 Tax=Natrononativus amylolyticus TaxID=2963434 RepID=UPI0020CC1946|nr:DUF1508 domain-containing protein [Natrononativus amylolyticus]
MSSVKEFHDTLFWLYEHYVGEPDSSKDVYGYWLFIVGYVVGAAGVFTFVVGYAGAIDSHSLIRVSGITAAGGLALLLFGIVLMLPVRKRGIQASAVGLLVSLVGVASFGLVYPSDWRGFGEDYSVEVTAVYATGVAIIAGVTALVPIVTGQKGKYVAEEGATDEPDVLTGDALEGAQFAVFRDEEGNWRWHVLHLEAVAASEDSSLTRPAAEAGIERVKSRIGSAGLLELTTSAFRLYEDREGNWQWTLARDDGSVVATCTEEFPERDGAEESVSFLKDRGPTADTIEIDGAAFTYAEERDSWHWTLLDADRTPLAESDGGYATQARAESAAATFAERFDGSRLLAIDHVGVELYERGEGWSWRFVDRDDDLLAASTAAVDSRRDAEAAAEAVLAELESAAITVAGEPTYELYDAGGWRWRLVDGTERVVARNPPTLEGRDAVANAADRFAAHAADAEVVEVEDAEYEVYPTEPETTAADEVAEGAEPTPDWHWRLVTADREVVAASTDAHADAEAAAAAIDRVREQASEADLIEFENAAFQVYEADSGEWRWRLIDEDGNVLADSGEEHTSRGDAAEAMMTLKEQAPDAELLEIDTAAFEIFVDGDDRWGWRLIDEGGALVAEDPATHPSRGAAREAMDRLLAHLESEVRTMERAAFQAYAAGDWHWRFVLPAGEVVAVSDGPHPTRNELVESLESVREAAAAGRLCPIGDVSVQVYDGSDWSWRLLDRDRQPIADAAATYGDREAAIEAVETLGAHAEDAPVFSIDDAAIRLRYGRGWRWDLIDADREVIARAASGERSREDAVCAVDDVRRLAPMAGRVDFDVASFELFADEDDRWGWRLFDEGGRTVATSTERYRSREAAATALEDVRGLIADASILELDGVSFELHAAGDGWVWRLVDRHGTTMSESTRTYETRTDAREAMNAVKVHAPDGWITFTE